MKAFATALLLIAAAACTTMPATEPAPAAQPAAAAPTPPAAPAAVNPVGRYEFATTLQGQMLTGTMEITGTSGAYAGRITSSATGPITITTVTVEGQTMTIAGDTPNGTLTIRMTFTDGGAFTGGWTLAGDGATLTGRRVS
ncbi:MAG TPA: hypothetical protein VGO40_14860 [Longimicrobium sp.]|jgi:hypothetical protein|nr:hypothetical protein [Longimicrobium sp.]